MTDNRVIAIKDLARIWNEICIYETLLVDKFH